jgi:hypothetical protein
MSWKQLTSAMAQRYQLARHERAWLALSFDAHGVQRVRVDLVSAFGAPWLLVRAEVCAETWLDARAALQRNDDQALGTLSLWDDVYYLRHTMPLVSVDADALAWTIETLARQAAELRHQHRPTLPAGARFALASVAAHDCAINFGGQ